MARIGFVHLGCPKNLVDTEQLLGLLQADGHHIVAEEADADLVLVNTCAFIDAAQRESVGQLARLAESGRRLLITGCLAQRFQEELLQLFPEAVAVVGTGDIAQIAAIVRRIEAGERVLAVSARPTAILDNDRARHHITGGPSVYLKITEGCDHRCAFCIIPELRGPFRSRPMASILADARRLAESGVRELVLVGQDTTRYGQDLGTSLAELLRALNAVDAVGWIRLMYTYPSMLDDALLETIAASRKVVKALDCPLQHTHPNMLRAMGRPVLDHEALVRHIREKIPGVAVRTSLIVGFPGETEAHFEHLCRSVERIRFERLGVFGYSDVAGAQSTALAGKVPRREIARRRRHLMGLQKQISLAHHKALVGREVDVLVESCQGKTFRGRTPWDAPEIDATAWGTGAATPGDILPTRTTHATAYSLRVKTL